MTDAEIEAAYQDTISEYVGFTVDWDNPPGPAAIALESLIANHDPVGDNIASESIDDLSQSYESKQDYYQNVLRPLNTIRRFKWLP